MGFKTKVILQKYKKSRYAIGNISEKYLLKIIKEFQKIGELPYEKKRPKYEPTDSYLHLARQLAKFMIRSDNLNWQDHGTNMTAPSSNVNVTDEDKSKEIILHETLSENSFTDISESKRNIINNTLLHKHSADVSENTITELKDI